MARKSVITYIIHDQQHDPQGRAERGEGGNVKTIRERGEDTSRSKDHREGEGGNAKPT